MSLCEVSWYYMLLMILLPPSSTLTDTLVPYTTLFRAAAGLVGASFIPGVGEALDLYTLFAPESAWWERALSLGSLGLSVFTLGTSPNFGAVGRDRKSTRLNSSH